MNEVHDSLIETIVFAMIEREKAKKTLWTHREDKNDLDLIILSTEYYIQANLWLLQSGKDGILGEVNI